MATTDEVAELRSLINDTAADPEFTLLELSAYIDAQNGDVRAAAGVVWQVKASRLAGLVDTTEGSSSRKLSQLYSQALEMSRFYGGSEAVSSGGRTRTRAIVRPT